MITLAKTLPDILLLHISLHSSLTAWVTLFMFIQLFTSSSYSYSDIFYLNSCSTHNSNFKPRFDWFQYRRTDLSSHVIFTVVFLWVFLEKNVQSISYRMVDFAKLQLFINNMSSKVSFFLLDTLYRVFLLIDLVQACLRAPHVVADEAKLAIVFTYFFLLFLFFSFFFFLLFLRLLLFTHFGESPVRENLFPPIFWHN